MIDFLVRFSWLLISCAIGYLAQEHLGGGVPCELAVLSFVFLAGIFIWYATIEEFKIRDK